MTNIIRVQTIWTGVAGSPWYSTHHFLDEDTSAGAVAAIDAVAAFWEDLSGNIIAAAHYEVQGDVARINDATGDLIGFYSVAGSGGNGVASGDLLPRATQGLIRWETGVVVNKRRLRGHTYVPGLVESLNAAGGVPVTAFVTIMSNAAGVLTSDADSTLVVYSPTNHTSAVVANGLGGTEWAVMRSRRD